MYVKQQTIILETFRDHPLFSAFSQEYREYAGEEGVKFTYTLLKNVDLSSGTTQRSKSI